MRDAGVNPASSAGPVARRPGWRRLAICPWLIACGLALLASFDLLELELDRRRAPEDRHRNLDAAAVEVEFFHKPVEGRERAVEDLDLVADLVVDLDLLLGCSGGLFLAVQHPRGFRLADRLGLAHAAEKAGDLRRVLDEVIYVVVHVQLGEDVAWHELALDRNLLAATGFRRGFSRDFDLLDELFETHPGRLGHDRVADLALEARIGVNDVPARHDGTLLTERV